MRTRLNPPSQLIFLVSAVLAVVAVLLYLDIFQVAQLRSFWVMTAAYVVLFIGVTFRRL